MWLVELRVSQTEWRHSSYHSCYQKEQVRNVWSSMHEVDIYHLGAAVQVLGISVTQLLPSGQAVCYVTEHSLNAMHWGLQWDGRRFG